LDVCLVACFEAVDAVRFGAAAEDDFFAVFFSVA